MENTRNGQGERTDSILLATNPDPKGFIFKYILCLTPLLLVIISWIVRILIYGMIAMIFPSVTSSLTPFVPNLTNLTDWTVLMISPIGIFVLCACIGWVMRLPEVWAGSVLSLGFSGLTAFFLVKGILVPAQSTGNPIDLLQWTGFLIQPFSIVAVIIVLAWTEKFRRSIRYAITEDAVRIKGGVWKLQEHILPIHQIGRVVLEQDRLGSIWNVGTVIPIGTTPWGSEMSVRGVGIGGQKDNVSAGLGYAKIRQEGSRYPLDCLYGIKEPQKAIALLERMICRPAKREEEQTSYLKKIYEKI
jgi:hypothetical protein